MRRFITSLITLLAAVVMFNSCQKKDTPSEVVEMFLQYNKEGNERGIYDTGNFVYGAVPYSNEDWDNWYKKDKREGNVERLIERYTELLDGIQIDSIISENIIPEGAPLGANKATVDAMATTDEEQEIVTFILWQDKRELWKVVDIKRED